MFILELSLMTARVYEIVTDILRGNCMFIVESCVCSI